MDATSSSQGTVFGRALAVWSGGEPADILDLVTTDYVGHMLHLGGARRTAWEYPGWIARYREANPGSRFAVVEQSSVGDLLWTRLTASRADGRTAHGMNVARFAGDRIVEEWAVWSEWHESPAPVVTLREITPANQALVEALAVTERQTDYVTGVADSLVEATQEPDACPWYRAVYADDEPVGFVMISDGITVVNPDYLGPYYLWRLIVDHRHQGRGYGSAALRLVVEHVSTRADARVLVTSCGQGPGSPLGFYLREGFRQTGEVHQGEVVLELDIPAAPPPG